MRHEEGQGYRHQRIEQLMLEELQAVLRDEIEDPALANVRATALVLSPDYRNARVHVAVEHASAKDGALRALTRATGFLRARIAEAIDLKRVPELRFVFDPV